MGNFLDKQQVNNRQTFFFVVFCLLILVNPFPLGSNRVWAWSLEAIAASGLLMIMVLCSLFSNKCISWHRIKRMKTELWLIGSWLLINLLYLIPIPVTLLNYISPTVASAYGGSGFEYGYLSLDVYASFQTMMLSVYYFTLFLLGVILVNTRKRIRIVLALMVFLGVFEAVYGMYLVSIGQTGTLVQVTSVAVNNASGTFINKNHLVAFLSMCFILGLSLRLMLSSKQESFSHLDFKVRLIRFISLPLRMLDFVLFLILAGIWNTHSRAGLSSFILAILFFLAFMFFNKKIKVINYKMILIGFSMVIALLVIVADDVNYFMESLGAKSIDSMGYVISSAEGRVMAVNQVAEHYSSYLLTGVGPGAYEVFFVNYRELGQVSFFDHAHNDYIEFLIEYGVLSIVLLVIVLLFLYKIFIFNFKTKSSFYRVLGIGVISCVIYMLLHGTMDFNARIPANIVTIILAISVIYGKIVMSSVNNKGVSSKL